MRAGSSGTGVRQSGPVLRQPDFTGSHCGPTGRVLECRGQGWTNSDIAPGRADRRTMYESAQDGIGGHHDIGGGLPCLEEHSIRRRVVLQRRPRNRLRRDLRRGAVAYIDCVAETRRGVFDATQQVPRSRVAAEQQMPDALVHHELLGRIMANEAGSLDGLAAARQDLRRLAHVAIHLSSGMATLRGSSALVDAKAVCALAGPPRLRLRRALIAYARTAHTFWCTAVHGSVLLFWRRGSYPESNFMPSKSAL